MDLHAFWKIILTDLELQVGKASFKAFLANTVLLSLTDNTAVIGCMQTMLISMIEKKYSDLIKKTLDEHTKTDNRIVFTSAPLDHVLKVEGPLFASIKEKSGTLPNRPNYRLNPNYTFKNFAVSSSNQMAYAAGTAVAKSPGKAYNPLFLYGGVGVGKTHLMQAIGHYVAEGKNPVKLFFCTGEEFTNDIIEAIGNRTTVSFKKKYRHLEMFLIDDVQFIAGKNTVQEEFFHTFNAIHQEGGQIILTSDRPPEEINKLEERLKSRFEAGLIVDIGQPDFELRTAILLIKAKQKNITLSMDFAKLIAVNVPNLRKLEGVLVQIINISKTREEEINENMIKEVLGKIYKENPPKNSVKIDDVLTAVADFYHLKIAQLKGTKRDRYLSRPRQILYYLLRNDLKTPLSKIGESLGGRDHTTIMYGVDKITELINKETVVKEDVLGIKKRIFG